MAKPKAATKAINLRIEYEYEQLVRDVIGRIRTGGPGFRRALRGLIEDDASAEYVPAREVHARFAALERQVKAQEESGESYLPEAQIDVRLRELESRLQAALQDANHTFVPAPELHSRFEDLERRVTEIEGDA